jgi:hypothetical protein
MLSLTAGVGIIIMLFALWDVLYPRWPVVLYHDTRDVPYIGLFVEGLESQQNVYCVVMAPRGARASTVIVTGKTTVPLFLAWARAAGLMVEQGHAGALGERSDPLNIREFISDLSIEASFADTDASASGLLAGHFRIESYCRYEDGVYTLVVSIPRSATTRASQSVRGGS